MPVSARRRRRRLSPLIALAGLLGLTAVPALALSPAVRAEGVLQRVARSGELRLIGPADVPPMLSLDGQGRPQGYGMVVAGRIAALLSEALGRPVQVRFEAVADPAQLAERLGTGRAELSCGLPFTWAREMTLDFSLPIGISGLRLMAPAGRFDGSAAGLAGRAIGVVADSLAETELRGMQPDARVVPFADLPAALGALASGRVEGVIGDSALLLALAAERGLRGFALSPEAPYERYALACAVPENDSAYRDLVNRAITGLLQGYVDGVPESVAAVDRWLGPGSALNLPPERIRGVFDGLLMGVEALRPLPAAAPR